MYRDDIFNDMMRLHRQMDRMLRFSGEQLPAHSRPGRDRNLATTRKPVCDLCETESSYMASVELPGVDKKDIQLDISDDQIIVKVEKKAENKEDNSHEYHATHQSFFRKIAMPKHVDSANAKASYKDGMLKVEVPKKQKEQSKRISIE